MGKSRSRKAAGCGDVLQDVDHADEVELPRHFRGRAGIERFHAGNALDQPAVFVAEFRAGQRPARRRLTECPQHRPVSAADVEHAALGGLTSIAVSKCGQQSLRTRRRLAGRLIEDGLLGPFGLVVDGIAGIERFHFAVPGVVDELLHAAAAWAQRTTARRRARGGSRK